MDQSTFEVRLAQWTEIVQADVNRPTGTLLRDWLDDNGISRDQYYYWKRKVRAHVYDSTKKSADSTAVSTVALAEVSMPRNYTAMNASGFQSDTLHTATINIKGIKLRNTVGIGAHRFGEMRMRVSELGYEMRD